MYVLQCQRVETAYAGNRVLDGIDLCLSPGGFTGLTGVNGSGKSTLLKSILDLVEIDAGRIRLFGQPHTRVHCRRELAYLPDRFSPPADVRCGDFLRFMLRLYGVPYRPRRVVDMLASLALEAAVLERRVGQLSKGMTQKIGLAACLLSEKKLLLLDEPMSGLDPQARILLKQQLAALKQRQVSVLFTSHSLADVVEVADTMAVLHRGHIVYDGAPGDFAQTWQADDIEQAYMRCIA